MNDTGIGEFLMFVGFAIGFCTGNLFRPVGRVRKKISDLEEKKRLGRISRFDSAWVFVHKCDKWLFVVSWVFMLLGAMFYLIRVFNGR